MKQIWNVYENMKDTIYAADIDSYELLYLNRHARELYGIHSLEELKGKKCYQVLQNSAAPCAMCTNSKITTGNVYCWEHYNHLLKEMFVLKDQMILHDNRRIRVEIATRVTDNNKNHRYNGIGDLSVLINECMRLSLEQIAPDHGIQQLIEYLGMMLLSDRVYIFELNQQRQWDNTYEWCASHVTAEIDNLKDIPYEETALWNQEFLQDHFVTIPDIEKIKESDPAVYHYLKPQNIHSIIVGPLYRDGELVGFYGIDNPPRDTIEEVSTMIKTIGHVIETMLQKRDLVHRLEELSYRDQMSKLGNRFAMEQFFKTVDPHDSIGIVYCDVCGLKRVNDTLGHAAGDKLLLSACNCLREAFDGYELYRIGGDELLAVVSGVSRQDFETCCRKIRTIILQKAIPLAVGSIWEPSIQEEYHTLIEQADTLMYQDKMAYYKNTGINPWRSETPWLGASKKFNDIIALMDYGFERALQEGQFSVYFQPQYNQRDHSLYGAEALVRWVHPEKGLISPDHFIPFLEHNGLISKLDEYVLQQTCHYQRTWLDAGLKIVPISVNLSRCDLQSEEICYRIKNTLEQEQLDFRYINLEVTESAYIENPETVIHVVETFRELGFKVEMDDFGSGYSSLNSLKDIPVDILKLDMKFISQNDHIGGKSGKILSSVVRMAHWLGMPVIGEGVETYEQAAFLSSIGCYYIQGYYFDRPMPHDEFEQRLMTQKPDLERDARITQRNNVSIDYLSSDGPVTLLFDNVIGAAALIEFDGERVGFIRCNDEFYQLFDLSEANDTKEQQGFARIFFDQQLDPYIRAMNQAIKTMGTSECETLNIAESQPYQPFWTRTKFRFLRGYDGIYTFFIVVDKIHHYKQALISNAKMYQLLDRMEQQGLFGSLLLQKDTTYHATYGNKTMADILGFPEADFQTELPDAENALIHPDDLPAFDQAIQQALDQNELMIEINVRMRCYNGTFKPIHATGFANRNADGTLLIKLVASEKVLPPVQSEESTNAAPLPPIADTIADVKTIVEAIGGSYIRCSVFEQRILEISDAFCSMLGYQTEDLSVSKYDHFESFIYEEDRMRVHKKLMHADRIGSLQFQFECRLNTRSGTPLWVHAEKHILTLSSGRREIYIMFKPLNEVFKLKQALNNQAHLQTLMDLNPHDGITYYKISGNRWNLAGFSQGYQAMFGYTMEQIHELTKNDLLALVHPDDREYVRQNAIAHAKERSNFIVQYRMIRTDGNYITILSYAQFMQQHGDLYLCQSNINASAIGDLVNI